METMNDFLGRSGMLPSLMKVKYNNVIATTVIANQIMMDLIITYFLKMSNSFFFF